MAPTAMRCRSPPGVRAWRYIINVPYLQTHTARAISHRRAECLILFIWNDRESGPSLNYYGDITILRGILEIIMKNLAEEQIMKTRFWKLPPILVNLSVSERQLFSHVRLFMTPLTVRPTRLLGPWNSPGKNCRVGSHSLLQGIFPT